MYKENLITYCDEVQSLVQDREFSTNFSKIKKMVDDFQAVIPVIGNFSSGKSSLLNFFLGDNVLPTNITPETSIAAELHYASTNYIEAVKQSGTVDKFDIASFEELKANASNYSYIKVFLSNEKLQAISPLVLVDMPGFNSPIGAHNDAILQYLDRGSYYIFLNTVEDGTIQLCMLNRMKEVVKVGKEFSFVLSKVNVVPEAQVSEVLQSVKEILIENFDYEKEVYTSGMNGEVIEKVLSSISIDKLYQTNFYSTIEAETLALLNNIDQAIRALKNTRSANESNILKIEGEIEKIQNSTNEIIYQIKEKYSSKQAIRLVDEVEKQINANRHELVNDITGGNEAGFKQKVTDIIQSALVSQYNELSADVRELIGDAINHLNFNSGDIADDYGDIIKKGLQSVLESQVNSGKVAEMIEGLGDTLATTIGSTSPIGRVLQVLWGLIKNILSSLLGKLFESLFQTQSKQDKVLSMLTSQLVPTIKSNLRQELIPMFANQMQALTKEILSSLEKQLQSQRDTIKHYQKLDEEDAQQRGEKINLLEDSKAKIKSLFATYIKV